MGPERYICECGQKYLTGATEWDHLGDAERRKRVWDGTVLAALFALVLAIPGGAIYLIFHRAIGALFVALLLVVSPFLMQVPFWLDVVASMWRTRVSVSVDRNRV